MAEESAIPTLLELDLAELKVTEGKAAKGIRFHRISMGGTVVQFLLHTPGTFTTVPWKPSVFGGDGSEPRLNLQINITDEQREAIENLEELIRDKLGIHAANWNSAVKPTDCGGLLRAKMNVDGPKQVQVTGILQELPDQWPQRANAYLQATCVYQQARAAGLLFEVVALDFGELGPTKSTNPFARRQK